MLISYAKVCVFVVTVVACSPTSTTLPAVDTTSCPDLGGSSLREADSTTCTRAFCAGVCKNLGLCTPVMESGHCNCLALYDSDCAGSPVCKSLYECMAWAGNCVVGAANGCGGDPCLKFGACSALDGRCIPLHDEDCQDKSLLCKQKGLCHACGNHFVCSADGDGFMHMECVALSDADCQQSDACAKEGKCFVSIGHHCTDTTP